MDRSRTSHQDHGSSGERLHLEVYHLPFDLLRILITNNSHQLNSFKLAEFCRDLDISHCFTSVGHSQANGEVEVANKTLRVSEELKIRLHHAKEMWIEELYHVLRGNQTTQRVPTGETPFNLTFGTQVVISLKIGLSYPG